MVAARRFKIEFELTQQSPNYPNSFTLIPIPPSIRLLIATSFFFFFFF